MSDLKAPSSVYRCPPDCGLCCSHLLVEADVIDVLREPRIQQAVPLEPGKHSLPVLECTWLMHDVARHCCPFLDAQKRCGIYPTRPHVCVGFSAGGTKCRELRTEAGLPLLEPSVADGSMEDTILAELVQYDEEECA